MQKKVIIVTGALGGIGTAIVKSLVGEGYSVVGTFRPGSEVKANYWLQEQFTDEERECVSLIEVDVSDFIMVEKAFKELLTKFERIYGLVNNAGITRDSTIKNMGHDSWLEVIDTNLSGCFNTIKCLFQHMIGSGLGRIVNISSINGQKGQFGQSNYSASKSGIYGLTKSVALEGARKGVTCNSISPGYVETEMTASIKPEILEAIVGDIPVGRLGRPDEIADVVSFLMREQAGYITGANLAVNGGQHMY